MLQNRLILIDGITGSGKSTTAQFICQQLEAAGRKAKWYHEEELGHPLESKFDVEHLQSEVEVDEFLQETPELWRRFADLIREDDRVHIIESYLLQDTARVLFQNNVATNRISQLIVSLLEIVAELNPALIYFWQEDVSASVRRIWARRGERWARWFIDTDANTPYSRHLPGEDSERAIALWQDYQAFANQLVDTLHIPKLCIENSTGDWQQYRQQMAEFLGISLQTDVTTDMATVYGSYIGTTGDRQITCTIGYDGERVFLENNFLWPKMWLQPKGRDVLLIESLPLSLHYIKDSSGQVAAVKLEGISRWNGCVLTKVE